MIFFFSQTSSEARLFSEMVWLEDVDCLVMICLQQKSTAGERNRKHRGNLQNESFQALSITLAHTHTRIENSLNHGENTCHFMHQYPARMFIKNSPSAHLCQKNMKFIKQPNLSYLNYNPNVWNIHLHLP